MMKPLQWLLLHCFLKSLLLTVCSSSIKTPGFIGCLADCSALYKSGHKWGIGQQPALYHKWCSKKIWPEYQENGSEEASEIFANILCKYWPKFCAIFDHRIGFVLSGARKAEGRLSKASLILEFSFEVVSFIQNCKIGIKVQIIHCVSLESCQNSKGIFEREERRTEWSCSLSQNVNLKVVKAETRKEK